MSVLVFSAHALDYLWRIGGTIAQYAASGEHVHVVCLTYGERGESPALWKRYPDITLDEIKAVRRKEAEAAAGILGCSIEFLDFGDNPLKVDEERYHQLVRILRRERPRIVITHTPASDTNPDHMATGVETLRAVRYACYHGVCPELPVISRPQVFVFEHMNPEFDDFKPLVYMDITDVIEVKRKAMQQVATQAGQCDVYIAKAAYRAWVGRDVYGTPQMKYAECLQPITPYVGNRLPEQAESYIGSGASRA